MAGTGHYTPNFGSGNSFGNNSNFGTGDQTNYAAAPGRSSGAEPSGDRSRNVFVVHGRDEEARQAMFDLLRRVDLHPLDWEDLVRGTGKATPYLGEIVVRATGLAQAALVLLTPDDVVHLHEDLWAEQDPWYETGPVGQPRPNVLIELGMVLMAYPEHTLIVEAGSLRPIADLGGMNVIKYDGSARSVGKVVERLKSAGCRVNDIGSDWRAMSHQQLRAFRRRP